MKKIPRLLLCTVMAGTFLAGPALPARADETKAKTHKQLAAARLATARYHDISQALADGYVDIDVYIPGIGFHYLLPRVLDGTFEADRPELLVYAATHEEGCLRLVAVEYAVPLELSETTPEGFFGDEDVWTRSEEFGLWTLHAWIWLQNPNGIFAPHNPRVR